MAPDLSEKVILLNNPEKPTPASDSVKIKTIKSTIMHILCWFCVPETYI